jgi:putative transposase
VINKFIKGKNDSNPGGTGFQPVRKRNLPHWEIGGSTYFITFRTKRVDLSRKARLIILNACLHFSGQRYYLWSAVVMPDHVHLLLTPKEKDNGQCYSLSTILHSIKSFTSQEINKLVKRRGSLWLDESYDRIVRDEEEFLEKWNYIRNNPVKKELCEYPEDWDAFYECPAENAEGNYSDLL